jgi:hypothetical protein
MSEEQQAIQQTLVDRYERMRNTRVDPREDNALAITTDGRKLALDARMLSPGAPDYPGSKINGLAAEVVRTWHETAATRSTQMIFCDMGVHPNPFSVYDEIVVKLTAGGIPREQIAVIGDADSDAKKRSLFDRVRSGQVRVLIGSTTKMGTGTNVQKRLKRKHDLDAPWKPAEVEQRDGRILRQGNDHDEVEITRYVTTGSFDSFMWQTLETKARFINQIMTGDTSVRKAEDIGGQELSYAEVKAIASGNPAVLTLAEADAELQRLAVLRKSHMDEQFLARRSLRELPERIERLKERLDGLTADQDTLKAHDDLSAEARRAKGDLSSEASAKEDDRITIGGRAVAGQDAVAALGVRLETLPRQVMQPQRIPLGAYRGLRFGMVLHPQWRPEVYLEGAVTRQDTLSREHQGPRAVLNALERLARGYGIEGDRTRQDLKLAETQLRDYQARLGQPFPHESYLSTLTALRDQLKAGLSGASPEAGTHTPPVSELAAQIKTLRASQTIEAPAERTGKRRADAEEPVTARIRRRGEPRNECGTPAATPITRQEPLANRHPWAMRARGQETLAEAEGRSL